MAIHEDNTQQQPQQQQATQPQQQTAQAAPQQQGFAQSQQQSIFNLDQQFVRSGRVDGGDNRCAEALQIAQRLKEEAVANQDLKGSFQILRFDRDANRVGYSSLLVVKTAKINGVNSVFVRTLMMPNNAIKIPNRKLQFGGGFGSMTEVVEVEVEAHDVFSANYWNKISEFVRNSLGAPDAVVYSVGGYVIPSDFDLKDEHTLKQTLIRSVNLCDDMMARQTGERPFSVSMLKGTDEIVSAHLDFSGENQQDQLGNPIRSDITVSLKRGRKDQQQENEYYEADSTINQLSMIVDLEYSPQQQQSMFGQQQQFQPPCTAAIIVTDRRNAPWIKANTMELDLFALSNAFRVTANQSWARSLTPVVGKAKDLRDIGALGLLSPQAKAIDTKTETFTQQNFAELMMAMVKPNPVFMIDLDSMGDNGFIDSVWLDTIGGPNQSKAKAAIVQSINNLIGQDFKQFFDYTTKPFLQPYGSTINKGYYYAGDEKRDRRDLDVLGALNASEGNVQEWFSWYGTQCNTGIQAEIRNKQSKNFDKQYLGQVTYTGKAVRCILNPEFIQGLDAAIAAAGLQVVMDNVAMSFGAQRFQGNMAIGSFAVSGSAQVASSFGGQSNFNTYTQSGVGMNSFYQ